MKNAEAKELVKSGSRGIFYLIDPIQSFLEGEKGHQDQLLVIAHNRSLPNLPDPVLWNAGKRSFDIIKSELNGVITQADMEELFDNTFLELVEIWNTYVDMTYPTIQDDRVHVFSPESIKPMEDFLPISVDPKLSFPSLFVEPYIDIIDTLFEEYNLVSGENGFVYNREIMVAYFTLVNVESIAATAFISDGTGIDYEAATRWLDKMDTYNKKKEAIEQRHEFLKRQKSELMNSLRHAKRNEAMQLVTDDWSQRKSDFRSAERAGIYYADWLVEKDFEYEPRTITTWIRKYAKENGIKLR
jgi:hypothetical protein